MGSGTRMIRRGVLMLLMVLGFAGLAITPASARELCNENGSLALADGDGDGVVSRGEIQAIINAAGGAEGAAQLQEVLNGLPGDVTGIRYVNCAGSGDGSGTGDGDGNGDGAGTDGGSGDGSGTGDGNGNATGTGDGSGTSDTSGTVNAAGTDGDGTTAGSGEAGEVVINAEGTPVNSITGLPDTGQGTGLQASGTAAIGLALAIAGLITVLGAYSLRTRALHR